MDRLILELKMPPAEAYYKLRHTIDEVNEALEAARQLRAGIKGTTEVWMCDDVYMMYVMTCT